MSKESDGVCVPLTVSDTVGEVVPGTLADAVLVTEPASRSAWVTVSRPVQVRVAPGARPAAGTAGQETDAMRLSETLTASVRVTLPAFVTSNS